MHVARTFPVQIVRCPGRPIGYETRSGGPVSEAAPHTLLQQGNQVSELHGSNILVTGGTGSFGKAFIRYALDNLDPLAGS